MGDVTVPAPAEPGLCAGCRYAQANRTRRGTTYLRCARASWDDRLAKYPHLPVLLCVGHEPTTASPDAGQGCMNR